MNVCPSRRLFCDLRSVELGSTQAAEAYMIIQLALTQCLVPNKGRCVQIIFEQHPTF